LAYVWSRCTLELTDIAGATADTAPRHDTGGSSPMQANRNPLGVIRDG
jgi:hypothetical protein